VGVCRKLEKVLGWAQVLGIQVTSNTESAWGLTAKSFEPVLRLMIAAGIYNEMGDQRCNNAHMGFSRLFPELTFDRVLWHSSRHLSYASYHEDRWCSPTEALNFKLHVRFLRQPVSLNDSKGRARVGVERAEIIGRR
jgi:hypothetical protein